MPEPVIVNEPKVEIKPEPVAGEPDILTRVAQFKPELEPAKMDKFNINELDTAIEAVQDPNIKNQMLGLKKSLIRGENEKYQELAKLRKDYETKIADVNSWTPQKVQMLLNNPEFIKSAQNIVSTTEDSGLSAEDKRILSETKEQARQALEQNARIVRQQQDERLKVKYAGYNPNVIDEVLSGVAKQTIIPTVEDVWKMVDYDNAVNRAYQLGLQDKKSGISDKINSTSIGGTTIVNTEKVEKATGEDSQSFLKRLFLSNLSKQVVKK